MIFKTVIFYSINVIFSVARSIVYVHKGLPENNSNLNDRRFVSFSSDLVFF